MNEPQEGAQTPEARIAAVVRKHREELHEEGVCICGWHANREDGYPEHFTAVLVEALGLTPEWTWSWPNSSAMGVPGFGYSVATRAEAEADGGEYTIVRRLVTKWEQQP